MTPEDWATIIHFKPQEFDSPDMPGSGVNMELDTVRKLDAARQIAGIPFKVTSGYRTVAHNAMVGGVPSSAHLRGRAVDISALTPHSRSTVVRSLLAAGFTRIEVSISHVHGDTMSGPAYPQDLLLIELPGGRIA